MAVLSACVSLPLAALQKAELVLVISVDVLNLGANTGNDDHPSLLALGYKKKVRHNLLIKFPNVI